MASSNEARHGLAVCEDCESVQPVEVEPGGEIRTVGNPTCQCGANDFRILEG